MQFASLHQALMGFEPYCEEDYFDLDTILDQGIVDLPLKYVAEAKAEALELIASPKTDDELFDLLLATAGRPGGGHSMRTFLNYVVSRLDDLAAVNPASEPPPARGAVDGPWHEAHFFTEQVGREATLRVMSQNEQQVRGWLDDPDGPPRLHLLGEAMRPPGTSTPMPATGQWLLDHERGHKRDAPRETLLVAVLVERTEPGKLKVLAAYPEPEQDYSARDRYPLLPALLGGFFGHDRPRIDRVPVIYMDDVIDRAVPASALGPMADELARCLTENSALDDDQWRYLAHALGACVQPRQDIQGWLVGLHRRMTRLDWGPESLAVVRGTQAGPRPL